MRIGIMQKNSYDEKKLLVFVPTYNEQISIKQCLEEIQSACKKISHKIVVINDGSNDLTPKLLKKFDDILIISHKANFGYSSTLETAIKYVYERRNIYTHFIFVDADCENNNGLKNIMSLNFSEYNAVIGIRSRRNRFIEWVPFWGFRKKWICYDPFCGLKLFNVSKFDFKHYYAEKFLIPNILKLDDVKQVSFQSRYANRPSKFDSRRLASELKLFCLYISLYNYVL